MKTKYNLAALIAFILVASFCLTGCSRPELYSQGSRAGIVQKLSYKGEIANQKTYEGELLTNAATNQIWLFSVDPADKDVVADLDKARKSGQRVDLSYEQWRHDDTRRTFGTEYRIKKVTFL